MSGPIEASSALEQRGIDLVPPSQRYGSPSGLFFLWAGTTTNIFTVSYGALLVLTFGLSFGQAIAAIVVGNLIAYPLLGLTSVQGPTTGTTTITISRSAFGPNGARMNGVLSWLMCLGFEAGGLVLVYYAVESLFALAGVDLSGVTRIVTILLLGLVQMVLPLVGHAFLMRIQTVLTVIFALAFVVLAILVVPKTQVTASTAQSDVMTMVSAISLVVVSGGLSWAPSGANFSRYLPSDSKPVAVGFWAGAGGLVPYLLLQTLGAAMATVVVGDEVDLTNPLAVPAVLPSAFSLPFLLLVALGLMAQNSTNLYSSGLNLQTAGVNAPRIMIVVIDSILCVIVTIVAVWQSSFYTLLNAFVGSMSIWLAPWVTVYLIDWWRRRGRYDLAGLANEHGGPYWGRNGIHWPGMGAFLAGVLAAALFANTGYFVGPLTALLSPAEPAHSPDLAIIMGMVVAGVVYLTSSRTGTATVPTN